MGLAMCLPLFAAAQQKPEARVSVYRYRLDSLNYVANVQLDVPTSRLVFKPVPGGWGPRMHIELLLKNDQGVIDAAKLRLISPVIKDSADAKPDVNLQHSFAARAGKYTMGIKLADSHTRDSAGARGEVPVDLQLPESQGFSLSDQQLYVMTGDKGSPMPNHHGFVAAAYNKLVVHVEAYHNGKPAVAAINTRLVRMPLRQPIEIGRVERKDIGPKLPYTVTLDISNLTSGNYAVVTELLNAQQQVIVSQERKFSRSNPAADKLAEQTKPRTEVIEGTFVQRIKGPAVKRYLASLIPLATEAEKHTIHSLVKDSDTLGQKAYLLEFFRRRDRVNPEEPFETYKQRLEYAEQRYKTPTMRIHETDRGRVLIQYGVPNQVENEVNDRTRDQFQQGRVLPYEIWQYYRIEDRNQANVTFVFIQENQGNNNYKLVHSSAIGEVKFPEWRQALQNRNTNSNSFNLMPNER